MRARCDRASIGRGDLPKGDSGVSAFGACQDFTDCSRKLFDPCAGDDNGIPAAMSLFGNSQELAAIVFAELHMEVLPLDLEFSCLDDVIHY